MNARGLKGEKSQVLKRGFPKIGIKFNSSRCMFGLSREGLQKKYWGPQKYHVVYLIKHKGCSISIVQNSPNESLEKGVDRQNQILSMVHLPGFGHRKDGPIDILAVSHHILTHTPSNSWGTAAPNNYASVVTHLVSTSSLQVQ